MKCTELGFSPTMRPGVMQRGSGGCGEGVVANLDRVGILHGAIRPVVASAYQCRSCRVADPSVVPPKPDGLAALWRACWPPGGWAYVNPRVVPAPHEFEVPAPAVAAAHLAMLRYKIAA